METTIKTLAYANLDIAPDNPDAFDISSVSLNVMRINCYPKIHCYVLECRDSEIERLNYCKVYNTIDEACKAFRQIIDNNKVSVVALSKDFDDYFCEDEPYVPSATYGDYSPSNPWNAPGMSVHDFI